jgi:hypothetical protein
VVQDQQIDLPQFEGQRNGRVWPGVGGKIYSAKGLGQSLLYVGTFVADGALRRLYELAQGRQIASAEPGFFSTTANAWATALTAMCLLALLERFDVPLSVSLFTALTYTYGTMALVYAALSFDIVLSTLLVLGAFTALFRSFPSGGVAGSLATGALFGGAFMTRPANLILAAPAAYFVAAQFRRAVGDPAPLIRRLVAMLGGAAPFVMAQGLYNWRRFGSVLEFGAGSGQFAANLMESLPAVLLSPGRGIPFYAAAAALGVLGTRTLLRRHPAEARTVLAVAALNLMLYSKWSGWATPNTWGPRFQLLTVAILMVPFGLWLSQSWDKALRRRTILPVGFFAFGFGLQAAALLVGFPRLGAEFTEFWSWQGSQIQSVLASTIRGLKTLDVHALRSWWVNPGSGAIPGPRAALPLLLLALGSAAAVVTALRRSRPPSVTTRPSEDAEKVDEALDVAG